MSDIKQKIQLHVIRTLNSRKINGSKPKEQQPSTTYSTTAWLITSRRNKVKTTFSAQSLT